MVIDGLGKNYRVQLRHALQRRDLSDLSGGPLWNWEFSLWAVGAARDRERENDAQKFR